MISKFVAVVLSLGILACNGNPSPPGPTPTPPFPTPTPGEPPGPTPPPRDGWSCPNPPALSGEIPVEDGIEGLYNVKRREFVRKSSTEDVASSSRIAGQLGGRDIKVWADGAWFSAQFEKDDLEGLRKSSSVQYWHKAVRMRAPKPKNYPFRHRAATQLPGLDRIDQRELPLNGQANLGDGAGVWFVGNDTGIYAAHPDFGGRVQPECFTAITFRGCDDGNGHGTHTASTSAGAKYGLNAKTLIFTARFLDAQGSGTDTDGARALDWTTDLKRRNPGKDIVTNLSWGGSLSPTVNEAVCRAIAAGVHVVAAAGNDYMSDSCQDSPAGVLQALTVGAMNPRDDNVADFSNAGGCVDLYAPGEGIEAAWLTGGTRTLDGTSMAAPHVSRVVIDYLQRHPGATPAEVHAAVVSAATLGTLNRVPAGTPNLLLFVIP